MTVDTDAVRAQIEALDQTFRKGDAQASAAIYDPDATIVQKGKSVHYGRAEIEKVIQAFVDLVGSSVVTYDKLTIEPAGAKFVVSTMLGKSATEKAGDMPFSAYQLWHNRDGQWLIVHDEFTSL